MDCNSDMASKNVSLVDLFGAVEATGACAILVDRDDRVVSASPRTLTMFMRDCDVIVGERIGDLIEQVDTENNAQAQHRATRGDGSTFPAKVTTRACTTGEIAWIVQDLTEATRAILNIRTALHAAPTPLAVISEENILTFANEALLATFGYEEEELVGCSADILVPEDMMSYYQKLRSGFWENPKRMSVGADRGYRARRKDGSTIPVRVGLNPISTPRGRAIIVAIVDLTEQTEAQAVISQHVAELERSNHDLEQFAYVASHDLQEPLRLISSYTQLLARRYGTQLDDDAHEFIEFAVDGARRMQSLINDLLNYSRLGTDEAPRSLVQTSTLVADVVKMLSVSIEENGCSIVVDELPPVECNPGQTQEIFQNLISNAIKYRCKERQCQIRISAQRVRGMVAFTVEDNGLGIEEEHFERIFVIFKRLHTSYYPGTGIGLALVKRIVEGHGGQIWLESTLGEGTRFHFSLPEPADVSAREATVD